MKPARGVLCSSTMRLSWLILASLALVSTGCFGSHGTGPLPTTDAGVDAGPRDAGPGCAIYPTLVGSLECGATPEGDAYAIVASSPGVCCGSGSPLVNIGVSVTDSGNRYGIDLEWTACDCCEPCACIGPTDTRRIELGYVGPGRHVVEAHGSSCAFEVGPLPECSPATADETLIARVLFSDQPLATTLTQRGGGGCGCTPNVALSGTRDLPGGLSVGLELCDCCDGCDCIDRGYQAHAEEPPLPVGDHEIGIPHGVTTVSVRERSSCRPLDATSLRVVPPDRELVQGGPPQTWALVGGVETLCCSPPLPAVDVGVGPGGEIALSLYSCVEADCECVGSPVAFEARVSLGVLGAGDHVVRAGAHEVAMRIE